MTTVDEIKHWLATATHGALATLAVDDGTPFASLVPYALDDGRGGPASPLLWLSDLAVHTKNLRADARCSLLVVDPGNTIPDPSPSTPHPPPPPDPLSSWRVTLVGRARIVEGGARERFFARHPAATLLPGFNTWRIDVDSARFIAGFGKMGTLDWRT